MLTTLGDAFRKLSMIVILVGLLSAFYTEVFSDIPIGKNGRPKPPLSEQRLTYLLILGGGVPGTVWAFARTAKGSQRTPWE